MAYTRDEINLRCRREQASDTILAELDKLPPLFGGDGSSLDNPIIVNSTSHAMSERLASGHVAKLLGKAGRDWLFAEQDVVVDSPTQGHVERWVAEELNGRRTVFYFDLSRSHGGSMDLLCRAFEMLVLDEAQPGLVTQ